MDKIPDPLEAGHLGRIDARTARAVREGLLPPGTARRIQLCARLLTGLVVSGEALASDWGVTRAAVQKHVRVLRDMGWVVESRPGSGYQLAAPPPGLQAEAVVPRLLACGAGADPGAASFLGLPYLHQEAAASTNDLVRSGAEEGWPAGSVAVVEQQTAGRGRLGRQWHSRRGDSLTFSVLLRPRVEPARLGLVSLAAATGVAQALARDLGLGSRVAVKWPNDVLVDGRKVCGILAEASIDLDSVRWVIVGVGVNVNGDPGALISSGEIIPGREAPWSLQGALGAPQAAAPLLAALLVRLGEAFDATAARPAAFQEAFRQFDCLRGSEIRVRLGMGEGAEVAGRGAGIAQDGSLLVQTADGGVTPVSGGDVFRVQ